MPEHSPAQKQYLLRVRRKKYMIHVSRILLFLGFLFLPFLFRFIDWLVMTGLFYSSFLMLNSQPQYCWL